MQQGLFSDFYALWPHKFNNKTNGVTPRRWLVSCNPELASLITETIGDSWITDLSQLKKLVPYAEDAKFRQRWHEIKKATKQSLIDYKKQQHNIGYQLKAGFSIK